jgi:hypothetical protein
MRTYAARTLLVCLAALSFQACAPAPEDALDLGEDSAAQAVASRREPGLDVTVRTAMVPTGTPTYGYNPQAPVMTVELRVEDSTLRQRRPRFNGLERPFALVPQALEGGATRWVRVPLTYQHTARAGYYGQIAVDVYSLGPARVADLDTLERLGVAVGLDTNVGTLWAQDPGANFVPAPLPR